MCICFCRSSKVLPRGINIGSSFLPFDLMFFQFNWAAFLLLSTRGTLEEMFGGEVADLSIVCLVAGNKFLLVFDVIFSLCCPVSVGGGKFSSGLKDALAEAFHRRMYRQAMSICSSQSIRGPGMVWSMSGSVEV